MKNRKVVDGYDAANGFKAELNDAGALIRYARTQSGYTQGQLGEMVGLKRAQVSRIESSENLTSSTVSKLMSALGTKVYLEVESDVDEEAFVSDLTECVVRFAIDNDLSISGAFNYLNNFGGVSFFRRYFHQEQSNSSEETLEHLLMVCRTNGGRI